MNNYMDQLVEIHLHLSMAIALLQELSTDLTKCMLTLERVGEQPHEVFRFTDMLNIHLSILDF